PGRFIALPDRRRISRDFLAVARIDCSRGRGERPRKIPSKRGIVTFGRAEQGLPTGRWLGRPHAGGFARCGKDVNNRCKARKSAALVLWKTCARPCRRSSS